MRVQGDERGEYERSESVEPAAHERARLRREEIRGGRGRVSRGGWEPTGVTVLFPMLTRRLTERTVRAGRLTMVWSAYFWCNPILFQSAASLIRCRLLARRSIGLPIGWSLRLTGPPQTPPPDRAGGFCSPPAPMTPPSPRADTLCCDLEWTHGDGPSPGDSRPLRRVARAVAVDSGCR